MSPSRALLALVRTGLLLVPLVPLAVGGELFFADVLYPFVTTKGLAFRGLVEVVFALWVVLALLEPRYRPRFSWILATATAFVAVMAVADALGTNPSRSLWGNLERMEGWVGIAHLLGLLVVAGSVLTGEKSWRLYFQISLAACTFVCLDALRQLEIFGVPAVSGPGEGSEATRLDARLGGPVYLAGYVLFHCFLAALFAYRARGTGVVWVHVGVLALCLVVLYRTGTRIAYAGLLAGAAIALLAARSAGPSRAIRVGLITVCALIALLVGLAWLQPAVLEGVPGLGRLAKAGEALTTRLSLWGVGWSAFLEHPLLGWGQHNFEPVLEQMFDAKRMRGAVWWDHPHNAVLSWLVAGGIVGGTAYVGLWVAAVAALRRAVPDRLPAGDAGVFAGMLAAYAVFALVQPDSVSSHIVFFSALAYLHALTARPPGEREPRAIPGWAVGVIGLAMVAGTYWTHDRLNATTARVARLWPEITAGPLTPTTMGRLHAATDNEFAVYTPARTEVREHLALWALQAAASGELEHGIRTVLLNLFVKQMQDEVASNPSRVQSLYLLGAILNALGRPDDALSHLERAIDLAPGRHFLYWEAAEAHRRRGRHAESVPLYGMVRRLNPSRRSNVGYARAVIYGDDREAEAVLMRDWRSLADYPTEFDPAIVEAFFAQKRTDALIEMYEALVTRSRRETAAGLPRIDVHIRRCTNLARAYAMAGRKTEAAALQREASDLRQRTGR